MFPSTSLSCTACLSGKYEEPAGRLVEKLKGNDISITCLSALHNMWSVTTVYNKNKRGGGGNEVRAAHTTVFHFNHLLLGNLSYFTLSLSSILMEVSFKCFNGCVPQSNRKTRSTHWSRNSLFSDMGQDRAKQNLKHTQKRIFNIPRTKSQLRPQTKTFLQQHIHYYTEPNKRLQSRFFSVHMCL